MNNEFTHFDQKGDAIMVDVTDKDNTNRQAIARGTIYLGEIALEGVMQEKIKKGDVLGVARIAGIMAVKSTSTMIPMCHPLQITSASIDFEIDRESYSITALCTVKLNGQTGVEMEALTGVSVALLTIYDMCKAITKDMTISGIMLVEKTGGKSDYIGREVIEETREEVLKKPKREPEKEPKKKTSDIKGIFQGED
jgi:cyclic pyranopterin phosphate synthase